MKLKKVALLMMVCCMCTACGTKEDTTPVVPEQVESTTEAVNEAVDTEETVEETTEAEVTTEATEETTEEAETETVVISPLPSTTDINALDNCTVAVSFNEGDIFVNETGEKQLKVTVHEYDLYDMVDIANLKEGDTIMIQGNEVVIETMETLESGLLFINGGMDNGGYDLWHNDSGVYFEHGYNDTKAYQPIGEITLKLAENFEFTDSSDLDKGEVTYTIDDIIKEDSGVTYNFTANNTSIVIENGEVTHMNRVYTP